MLLRRLVLVLIISSMFSMGLSRRHGGMKRKQNQDENVTDVPVTVMPPESTTTTQPGQQLTKVPRLHSNSFLVNGTSAEDKMHSSKTHVPGQEATPKLNVSKAEIDGLKHIPSVNGSKTEEVSINKIKSNVGKNSTNDAPDNHLKNVMPNLKADKNSTIFYNKSYSTTTGNKTEGGVGVAVSEKQDLDQEDDLSYTDEDGLTETLNPASKGVADIVNTFLRFWGPGQAWASIKQILFFHMFVISIYYLLDNILGGLITLINLKRTPLLIYKEVKDFKEDKPAPMPVLPPPHKDYGYEGGFKTPKGEQIKYVTYNEPHDQKAPAGPPKEAKDQGGPPKAAKDQGGPPKAAKDQGGPPPKTATHQGGPPDAGHPEPPKKAFHTPPPLAYQQGPVVPMGGGGAGPHQMSSYTSYGGEAGPHAAYG